MKPSEFFAECQSFMDEIRDYTNDLHEMKQKGYAPEYLHKMRVLRLEAMRHFAEMVQQEAEMLEFDMKANKPKPARKPARVLTAADFE